MTCTVALVEAGIIWMGADSVATNEDGEKWTFSNPKIFAKRDSKGTLWLIGYSGEYRFGQLIEHSLILPSVTNGHKENLLHFLVSDFVSDLRTCLRGNGAMSEDHESRREKAPGDMLVGINGQIFFVDEYFQVLAPANPFTATGSGSIAALGALGATRDLLGPEERVLVALEQAQEHTANVSDPFIIINSKDAEENVRCVRSVTRKRRRQIKK